MTVWNGSTVVHYLWQAPRIRECETQCAHGRSLSYFVQDFSTIGSWLPEEIDRESANCLLVRAHSRVCANSMCLPFFYCHSYMDNNVLQRGAILGVRESQLLQLCEPWARCFCFANLHSCIVFCTVVLPSGQSIRCSLEFELDGSCWLCQASYFNLK